MGIPFSVRIRGLFASNKEEFWWSHFTDEEKQLRRMDAWQLAKVIHEESVHQSTPEKRIVAEHLLNVRLAQIQAKASKWSGWLSLFGAVLASLVSFQLGHASARKSAEVVYNCYQGAQDTERPMQARKSPAIEPNAPNGAVKRTDPIDRKKGD